MRSKITYAGRTFTTPEIESVNLRLAVSPLSDHLEANTMTAVVRSKDTGLKNFRRNTPVWYYYRDRARFLSYLQSVEREGPDLYRLSGTSAVGLLIERPHEGGIYTGQTAQTIVSSICSGIPFQIHALLKDTKLYGWLPYAKPPERSARDNLAQVLFALGACLKTDLDGVLRIDPLWDGASGAFPWEKIFRGAKVLSDAPYSAVSVVEHHYMVGGDEEKLFEGETQTNDIIVFNEPMYSLSATGFRILSSGANFAKVSSGTGTLTGRKYIHNTRQIEQTVNSSAEQNIKSFDNATLISLVNSKATAERLAAYYKCNESIQADVILDNQSGGDIVIAYHPYDKIPSSACIKSLDINASGILRASADALIGYSPPQLKRVVTYDQHKLISSSGTVTLPDGVNSVRVVLIGGGNGGKGGGKGTNGTSGSGASASGSTNVSVNKGAAGKGGGGGSAGSGGTGGRVASFEINGVSIKTISVSIGGGGVGGSANGGTGGTGGNTTVTVNGVTYSSQSGSSTTAGYQDLVTGIVYATGGGSGKSGAAGGAGGAPDTTEAVSGKSGSAAGSYRGGSGGSGSYYGSGNKYAYATGGGGGGGGAYNAAGGAGGNGSGRNAGQGGTGASGSKPSTPSRYGAGGTGGNGGGGGGGGGGTLAVAQNGGSTSTNGGAAGSGGPGSQGGNGAPGCVILYYGVQQEIKGGALIDKNGKFLLDRLGRIIVT